MSGCAGARAEMCQEVATEENVEQLTIHNKSLEIEQATQKSDGKINDFQFLQHQINNNYKTKKVSKIQNHENTR